MNVSKKIAIGFLVFVFGMIFFSLIFAGCDKVTSSNKNNSEESSSFDKSLLKTDSSKEVKDIVVPVNKKWEVTDYNKDEDEEISAFNNDYCYSIDDNSKYITLWVRSFNNYYSSIDEIKKDFEDKKDYENKKYKKYELFDDIDALETTYIDKTCENYVHELNFIAYDEVYELEFYGKEDLSNEIDTVFTNVKSKLQIYIYKDTETTTTEETTDSYDNDYDYNYDDYDDYEEETTTKPKKDTLVYSNSKINIYFQDVTTEYDETYVNFKVKNKSSKKLDFQADTITLDGISYNDIVMSDPVAPKSTGIISAQVEKAPYKQPKTVGAELRCFDDNLNTDNISFVNVKVK